MPLSFLTDEQARFLRDEKEALADMRQTLTELGVAREGLMNLQEATLQLDELFLIVVVGEFNAGKSALVNALLGDGVLREGLTPTTSRVTLVKWGEQAGEQVIDEGYAIYTHPLRLLKEVNIVDTPGTNAVIRQHERLTNEFIPRSDLVLFITSADRPMTESERQFLQRILTWGKKIVFVLNKADIFESEAALREVEEFLRQHAAEVLGSAPVLFSASARMARRAWTEPDPEQRTLLRASSQLDALEQYITATLDDSARLRLKFMNPLGVADHLIFEAEQALQARAAGLQEDRETADALEAVIGGYQRDLDGELGPRLAEVENILHRLQQRGLDFFDSNLRLTNIQNLVRGDKVRGQFEKQVLADVPQQIEEQVQRMIDWLVQKDLHEWQQVMSYLQRRKSAHIDHMVGESGGPRETHRRELIDTVGKTVQTIVETYDRNKEASELASSVEAAVAQTALLEAGAVGLGALLTAVVLSSTLDITGTLAAGTMAILGLFVIPYKRKQAKENFREKMEALRVKLIETLTHQFRNECADAVTRLKDGVAPYTRYVRAERESIEQAEARVAELRQKLSALKARCDAVMK